MMPTPGAVPAPRAAPRTAPAVTDHDGSGVEDGAGDIGTPVRPTPAGPAQVITGSATVTGFSGRRGSGERSKKEKCGSYESQSHHRPPLKTLKNETVRAALQHYKILMRLAGRPQNLRRIARGQRWSVSRAWGGLCFARSHAEPTPALKGSQQERPAVTAGLSLSEARKSAARLLVRGPRRLARGGRALGQFRVLRVVRSGHGGRHRLRRSGGGRVLGGGRRLLRLG